MDGTWDALLAELQRGCDSEQTQWAVGVGVAVGTAAKPTDMGGQRRRVAGSRACCQWARASGEKRAYLTREATLVCPE